MRGLSIKSLAVFALTLFLVSAATAQEQKAPIKNVAEVVTRYVRCGALVQPESGKVQRNVLITIQGERIQQVQENAQAPASGQVIDLSDHTCLPGLIDTHTHTLLQGDITAADYDEQLLKESTAYRAILGTRSVRLMLGYGFTTIRDLETEGAGYADVDLKNAINKGIIPGPRMKVATRAMDVTGAYPLSGYSPEITVPHGVQIVDGAED
jgi:imidazolonepropionase-like amidohydrolase